MKTRRKFLLEGMRILAGTGLFFSSSFAGRGDLWAKTQRIILPKETERKTLIDSNPANLDTRNLDITPLKNFETMGITDYEVNLNDWRLEVTGQVKTPLSLTYSEMLSLPSIERRVLLICPGFFANHGQWKGILMKELLKKAKIENGVTHVTFKGPEGRYERARQFPIKDILANRVFLAYGVNGETLPKKHGFPLRAVAEGYYGFNWGKYVYKVTVDKM
jgi:sulfoxide reductase catalytic subunit YedY